MKGFGEMVQKVRALAVQAFRSTIQISSTCIQSCTALLVRSVSGEHSRVTEQDTRHPPEPLSMHTVVCFQTYMGAYIIYIHMYI